MGEGKKAPRMNEVLGVTPGHAFFIRNGIEKNGPFIIDPSGSVVYADKPTVIASGALLCLAVNHPHSVAEAAYLTEEERKICKAAGARWVSRDKGAKKVDLWSNKPDRMIYASPNPQYRPMYGSVLIASFERGFECILEGSCVCVDDVYGEGAE